MYRVLIFIVNQSKILQFSYSIRQMWNQSLRVMKYENPQKYEYNQFRANRYQFSKPQSAILNQRKMILENLSICQPFRKYFTQFFTIKNHEKWKQNNGMFSNESTIGTFEKHQKRLLGFANV